MDRKPLDDVTIVDLTRGYAGPLATALLAKLGATTTRVEPYRGAVDRYGGYGGDVLNNVMHNKRSISLDLGRDESHVVMDRLLADADVFVHSYSPGVMHRRGFDYENVKRINDEVIYCSITGFGEGGPYGGRKGSDSIAAAEAGLTWSTGEPDRKPSRVGGMAVDAGTGMLAAFAIMAGLWERGKSGEGQKIEASLFETAAMFVAPMYTHHSRTGGSTRRMGHSWDQFQPVGVFETADGPIYLVVAGQYAWKNFCEILGKEGWTDDPRLESPQQRLENVRYLHRLIEDELSEYDRVDILGELQHAGILAGKLQTIPEATTDEHLHERGTLATIRDLDGNEVVVGAEPIQFSRTPMEITRTPTEIGADTRDVLSELGFDGTEIGRFLEDEVVWEGHRSPYA